MTPQLVRVLSLGAGVQSSAMLLAYLSGALKPMPDFAVFADTQAEPDHVYTWLAKLREKSGDRIPIVVATKGSIVDDYLNKPGRFVSIPMFCLNEQGKLGMLRRQCTREYKIAVIQRAVRERLGYAKGERVKRHKVVTLIGISTDEATRMKPSRIPWIENQWPLIYDLNWSRKDCFDFISSQGLGLPSKSACYICPFHDNMTWKKMRRDDPGSFAKAVAFEKEVQARPDRTKMDRTPYLHRSCQPLDQIDFDKLAPNSPLFDDECEGMCGV